MSSTQTVDPSTTDTVSRVTGSDHPRTVSDLPDAVSERPMMQPLADVEIPEPLKDPVEPDDLEHRRFKATAFWKKVPAFADVDVEEFLDYRFQNRNSVTNVEQLAKVVGDIVDPRFLEDVRAGLGAAPMQMRLSPYTLGLVDWSDPWNDPIRIQFIPVASTRLPDHPRLLLDSLNEQGDSPATGIVHRYPDKALFLPLDVCPVYCRFCTRSYAIGGDTDMVDKVRYTPNKSRWQEVFAYVASRPELEDVVVSGGDAYMLAAKHLDEIGRTLLDIPHVRRIRLATKGPAVMPMKILTHDEWTDTLTSLVELGRKRHKEVCLHTHFNSTAEITEITRRAMNRLFELGIRVRNQAVMIKGVNDNVEEMIHLVRKLSFMNVQPYYVYQHDMVKGVEDLRTRVADTVEIERQVRGVTAGFNTPTFVNDVPGGGGKRDVHSYDYYDETTGVSVYRSPSVDDSKVYLYFDPIHLLPKTGRDRWADASEREIIVAEAIRGAGLRNLEPAVEM